MAYLSKLGSSPSWLFVLFFASPSWLICPYGSQAAPYQNSEGCVWPTLIGHQEVADRPAIQLAACICLPGHIRPTWDKNLPHALEKHAQQKYASNVASCMATHRCHLPVIVGVVGLAFQNRHELVNLVQWSLCPIYLVECGSISNVLTASLHKRTVRLILTHVENWDKA
jgi:hypothetical protein